MAVIGQCNCHRCGRAVELHGAHIVRDRLRYWSSYVCEHCGGSIEMDGIGIPPESFRQAVLREDGTWGLDVQVSGSQAVLALMCLRAELNLTLAEARVLKARFPGVAREGTRAEMHWLTKVLAARGVTATVVQLTRGTEG